MLAVYYFPGFMDSTLGILATGEVVWWDNAVAAVLGLGTLRLAPDGITPGPPDGLQMGVDLVPRPSGQVVQSSLKSQLDPAEWTVKVVPYDWRLDIIRNANSVATNIRNTATPATPATLVGHSEGGLVSLAAYAILATTGQTNLVRRIVTIGSPIGGSYVTAFIIGGVYPSMQYILSLSALSYFNPLVLATSFTLEFVNGVFLTWPAFYELWPSLVGAEAAADPNRALLYNVANYRPPASPSQAWLDYARGNWSELINSPAAFPPAWVLTCVAGDGFATGEKLTSSEIPLKLLSIGTTQHGDGVVTVASATRNPCAAVQVNAEHNTLPLAIALDGTLAKLIVDPRGPPSPPPPVLMIENPVTQKITEPPQSDPVSGEVCIGGHC